MEFSGLKGLLKKKKAAQAPPTTTAATTTTSSSSATRADPYAIALQTAAAARAAEPGTTTAENSNNNNRKRERESSLSPPLPPQEDASTLLSPIKDGASTVSQRQLLTAQDIVAQRAEGVDVLTAIMQSIASAWRRHTAADSSDSSRQTVSVPTALVQYLATRFTDEAAAPDGIPSDVDAEEWALLHGIAEEMARSGGADGDKATEGMAAATLSPLVVALVYLVCAHWRQAIAGVPAAAGGHLHGGVPVIGWCYPVYLHARQALPDDLQLAMGRHVTLQLEAWRTAQRTRRGAFQLLAYLIKDDGAMQLAGGNIKDIKESLIVPDALRDGLKAMIVVAVQQKKDFAMSRQAYADLTLGNANWKLGLFSAGEVHMRRAMERVERNRIAHLLNNEEAMKMLYSVRELVHFLEKEIPSGDREAFYHCEKLK